jgi:molybdopterin/thiamine biosynthesis adenylyltransferase/rhodanese-related sulfurtransferase/molybdopterin converting factor small subunit
MILRSDSNPKKSEFNRVDRGVPGLREGSVERPEPCAGVNLKYNTVIGKIVSPIRIVIPTPLRQYVGNQDIIEVEAASVGDALDALIERHDQLRRHLFADDGRLRNFVNVYVNEEDIRYLERDGTPLKAGDTISIVPSIAGGSFSLMDRLASQRKDVLSPTEIKRYSRHLILPEVGMAGQLKLKKSSALVIGAGGLGVPLTQYLSAAGVGRLGIVDFDVIDETNLHRQVLYGTKDVGRKKLEVARERVAQINPNVDVQTYDTKLSSENALDILRDYDVIIDGTDNFPTRYLVNDASVLLHKPNVYGSIFRFEGQASVFDARSGPCYRCLYAEPPPPGLVPSCAEGGVLGVLPGIIGSIQAVEALKILLGTGNSLIGRLLVFDALQMEFRELKLRKNPACPMCGSNPTIKELIDYEEFCGLRGPSEQVEDAFQIRVDELKGELDRGKEVVLLDVREPMEWEIAHLDRAVLMPVAQVPTRVNELSTADEIVVYCKTGVRSARITNFLRELGFRKVKNLVGGIDEWAEKVEPEMPRY